MLHTLILVAALATPSGGEEWGSEAGAARTLSRLFPGSQKLQDPSGTKRTLVAPVHRGGLVGFATNIQYATSGDTRWLAFDLELVAPPTGIVIKDAKAAIQHARKSVQYHRVAAVVVLNNGGKVVGKPAGWPLEADAYRDCAGDLCQLGFVTVKRIEAVHASPRGIPALFVEYVERGAHKFIGLGLRRQGLTTSSAVEGNLVDDPSGCRFARKVTPEVAGCNFVLNVDDRCEWKECRFDCKRDGFTGPSRRQSKVLMSNMCAAKKKR